ncbi:MAG TPA: SPOR domain-containing protein [Gammaproteobacteria bacterium]|nr:SPOR domain-containing protein [Gammaproteobacteria bacterium]
MKIVFLALLLLNLGLLGWHVWVAPAPQPARSAGDAVLSALRHSPTSTPPRPAPVAVQPAAATADVPSERPSGAVADAAVCAEFGPFAEHLGATAVAAALGQRGAQFAITSHATSVIGSFRVYFPPYPTAAAAEDMGARLRRAGVKDVYIIPGGAQRNAVSVGVFKDRDGAERRRRHLNELGFEPQVEPLERHDETRYWIRASDTSAAALLRQAAKESGGKKRIVRCTPIAAAAVNP